MSQELLHSSKASLYLYLYAHGGERASPNYVLLAVHTYVDNTLRFYVPRNDGNTADDPIDSVPSTAIRLPARHIIN